MPYHNVNIAALQVEDAPVDENNALRTCWFGYTNVYSNHFACSGMGLDCVDSVRDDENCVQVNYWGSPDIIVTPGELE